MPNEYIGTCGRARLPDREAISVELEFGIACLRHRYGTEPSGSWLEVLWHDHDSGSYPTISLVWGEGSLSNKEWQYIERCRKTLTLLDDYIDWDALHSFTENRFTTERRTAGDSWIAAFCGFCGFLSCW